MNMGQGNTLGIPNDIEVFKFLSEDLLVLY